MLQKKDIYKTLHIDLHEILVEIKKNKSLFGIRISIKPHNACIVLSYGRFVREKTALEFLRVKKNWIEANIQKLNKINPILRVRHTKAEIKEYSKTAFDVATKRLQYFNKHYNFVYKKIFIKNQKSKWGSCSSKNNLNFNYKLALLPKELQDYLVVHELCHLKEMNHSKAFWSLVEEQIPKAKMLSKKLRIGDF